MLSRKGPVVSVDSHWGLGIILSKGLEGHFHIGSITSKVISIGVVDTCDCLYDTTELGGGRRVDMPTGTCREPLYLDTGHCELVVVASHLLPSRRGVDTIDIGHDALELEPAEAVYEGSGRIASNGLHLKDSRQLLGIVPRLIHCRCDLLHVALPLPGGPYACLALVLLPGGLVSQHGHTTFRRHL